MAQKKKEKLEKLPKDETSELHLQKSRNEDTSLGPRQYEHAQVLVLPSQPAAPLLPSSTFSDRALCSLE